MITEKDIVVGAKFTDGKNFVTIYRTKCIDGYDYFGFVQQGEYFSKPENYMWVRKYIIEHLNNCNYKLMDKPKEEKAAITLNGKERILNVTKAEELGILEDVPPVFKIEFKDCSAGTFFKVCQYVCLVSRFYDEAKTFDYILFENGDYAGTFRQTLEGMIGWLNNNNAVKVNTKLQTV